MEAVICLTESSFHVLYHVFPYVGALLTFIVKFMSEATLCLRQQVWQVQDVNSLTSIQIVTVKIHGMN